MTNFLTLILLSILFFGMQSKVLAAKVFPKNSIYQFEHQWINQDGKKIDMKQLNGSPTIATLTYTSCPGACPLMVSDIKYFDRQLTKNEKSKVKFMTFSIDPERDTPAALKIFYNKMKLDRRWTLLTSNANQVRELAAVLGFGYKDIGGGDFSHSSTLYLLSADGEILARKERNSDWKEFLDKFKSDVKKAKR